MIAVYRDESQLLLLIRALYDNLPSSLVILSVSEGRGAERALMSMSRELVLTCQQRQKTFVRPSQCGTMREGKLQADSDCHALTLVDLIC